MWLVKNKIWAGDYKIFVNKPTRNAEGYWEDLTEFNNDDDDNTYPYKCVGNMHTYCIPYNDGTKHLVATKDEAPKYYRYWEEK